MKLDEVPQDQDPSFAGEKKLCYAVNAHGRIVQAQSSGWSTEEIVKSLAWKVIEDDLEQTRHRVSCGQASPLLYFMKMRQMDARLLAQNMQTFTWRVRWHLRPKVFANLNSAWLRRYADCLEVEAETLRNFSGGEP